MLLESQETNPMFFFHSSRFCIINKCRGKIFKTIFLYYPHLLTFILNNIGIINGFECFIQWLATKVPLFNAWRSSYPVIVTYEVMWRQLTPTSCQSFDITSSINDLMPESFEPNFNLYPSQNPMSFQLEFMSKTPLFNLLFVTCLQKQLG